jgi:hypothetical protein
MRPGINVRTTAVDYPRTCVDRNRACRDALDLIAPDEHIGEPRKRRTLSVKDAHILEERRFALRRGRPLCLTRSGKRDQKRASIKIEGSKRPRTRVLAAPTSFLNRVYDLISLSPAFVVVRLTSCRSSN